MLTRVHAAMHFQCALRLSGLAVAIVNDDLLANGVRREELVVVEDIELCQAVG